MKSAKLGSNCATLLTERYSLTVYNQYDDSILHLLPSIQFCYVVCSCKLGFMMFAFVLACEPTA